MLVHIDLYMNKQQDAVKDALGQTKTASLEASRNLWDVRRLAPTDRERLFKGLERFVNTSDSLDEYKALGTGWSGFWPRELLGRNGKSLAWISDFHALFLVFRNQLRYVWTPLADPLKRGAVSFLLSIGAEFETLESGGVVFLPPAGLSDAWNTVTKHEPSVSGTSRPLLYPQWTSGSLSYVPQNDFQRAFYLLFRESWRAKVCAKCATYFVASKPAQLYCGTACSGGVKRERARNWWRETGSKMRIDKARARAKRSSKKRRRPGQ
jgi:hypothetical protein